jgi:hypothetical protein
MPSNTMKIFPLTISLIIGLQVSTFGQVIKLTDVEIDSVEVLIGHTFPFPVNYAFNGEKFLENGTIDSLSIQFGDKGYFDDLDAHYQVHHEYQVKFDENGSIQILDAKYLYDDGIDVYVNYHFIMKPYSNATNCWFVGNFGHIMPVSELSFQIEPFNFEEALRKVGEWWSQEFEQNRDKYIQN